MLKNNRPITHLLRTEKHETIMWEKKDDKMLKYRLDQIKKKNKGILVVQVLNYYSVSRDLFPYR